LTRTAKAAIRAMMVAANTLRDLRAEAIPAAEAIREAVAVTARKQLSLAAGPAQRSGPFSVPKHLSVHAEGI
jgi:hypothetical protein